MASVKGTPQPSPIPVIDISSTDAQDGSCIVSAAARYGFVFVKGEALGFSPRSLDTMFALIGWSPMHSEILDPAHQKRGDFKESAAIAQFLSVQLISSRVINFGEFQKGKAAQYLPPILATHEPEIGEFESRCHQLCVKLLRLFAKGLKIGASDGGQEWFAARHDKAGGSSGSVLRWLHYPAVERTAFDDSVDVRAGAHSDYGSLTLLFQRPGQHGLEILTTSGNWAPVPVYPPGTEPLPFPPILVNIGDLMQFWTNGMLKSTVHRVVFPKGDFQDSQMVMKRSPYLQKHREKITAEDYLKEKIKETYG